jgi:hypothetical protein
MLALENCPFWERALPLLERKFAMRQAPALENRLRSEDAIDTARAL